MIASAFHQHNHQHCVQDALASAERCCQAEGARLTPLRRRVLELVWGSHRPLGAYELLDLLTAEGHKPAPPTVYRALDFLQEQQLVHRLASRNAFIGCRYPGGCQAGYFLICERCGNAEEMTEAASLNLALLHLANAQGFHIRQAILEVSGLCAHCQAENK